MRLFVWWQQANKADRRDESITLARMTGERACRAHTWMVGLHLDEQTGELHDAEFRAQQLSNRGVPFAVRYDAARDDAICGCLAGKAKLPCWHRGMATLMGRELRKGQWWWSWRQGS